MAHLITGTSCVEAWIKAANYILDNKSGENLLVQISNPASIIESEIKSLNPLGQKGHNIFDVANTIFPEKLWQRNAKFPRSIFYEKYVDIHNRSRNKRWGTYFLRFIAFGKSKKNQLESIVNAISVRDTNYTSAYTIHITSCEIDSNIKIMGGPCLQYIQIMPNQSTINLVAVYRNHDYFNKALGNFVGLARLLDFLCTQADKKPGRITCHSVHYYIDKTKATRQLLKNIDNGYNQ